MPVHKYRSVQEMKQLPPAHPLDWQNLRQAFELMELTTRLFPIRYAPGVRRFRTSEDANRYRDVVQTTQARRARPA
jgi:hypothetical protein